MTKPATQCPAARKSLSCFWLAFVTLERWRHLEGEAGVNGQVPDPMCEYNIVLLASST